MCILIFIFIILLTTTQDALSATENSDGDSHKDLLQELHLSPSIISDDQLPALHKAAKNGDWQTIFKLFADGKSMNALNGYRQTALHLAAAFNQIEAAVALLQRKGNPNNRCTLGYTPLHLAAAFGHSEMVQLMIAFNARPHELSNMGDSPQTLAAMNGHYKTIKIIRQAISDELQIEQAPRPASAPPMAKKSKTSSPTCTHSTPLCLTDSIQTPTT